MTSVFHITLRPILILCKCIGLISISYIVEPTGVLVQNITLTFHVFLEISRMIVLLICTYLYLNQFNQELYVLQMLNTFKFWIIIIAARLSTKWIIKFINGIIEFDRKIIPLSAHLVTPQRLWTKKHWNTIFISIFAYFIAFKSFSFYLYPIKIDSIKSLAYNTLFSIPYIMDYVVTISSCFFLHNLYARFQTLNDFWKCLPADLIPASSQWTHIEIVGLMENTRLLHSELCDLLNVFSIGYGPLLLGLYTCSYVNLLISIYFLVNSEVLASLNSNKNNWEKLLPLLVHAQIITFLMSIIVFVSFINEKRLKMISYLRLYRISNLHLDKKQQIKMFMNQISVCDYDQISAFGFFNINLNLVTSILVLLISGVIALIQMKDHPMILTLNNDTKSFLRQLYNTKNKN